MPDSKEISALTTAESTSASDLFETAIPNAMTETGYVSRKVTLGTIANFLLGTLQFSSLHTTVKNIIGAINELAQGSGQSLDALNDVDIDTQTLTNGQGIVYDATAQKWKNGAVSGGGHTYSTTEQVVGTWIDGSTLYEKSFSQVLGNSPTTITHGVSNIDKVVDIQQVVYNPTTHANKPIVPSSSAFTSMFITDTLISGDNSSADIDKLWLITIRYTKSST